MAADLGKTVPNVENLRKCLMPRDGEKSKRHKRTFSRTFDGLVQQRMDLTLRASTPSSLATSPPRSGQFQSFGG
jgi:hypothetical protein